MISVYNQLHYLPKALSSAVDQSYENIEIVIGDDASTDGDVETVLSSYPNKNVKYFRSSFNLGINANYRALLNDYSTGDLALLLNADDYLIDKEFVSKAVELFLLDSEISLVFGNARKYIEHSDEYVSDACNDGLHRISDGNTFFLNYWKGYSISHAACIYDRRRALDLGFYLEKSVSEDLESFFRLVIDKKVGHLDSEVSVWVKHQANFTNSMEQYFLENATNFIDKPYLYAVERDLDSNSLEKWRTEMLRRYYLKILVKLHYLAPTKITEYSKHMRDIHPEMSDNVLNDWRYKIFKVISGRRRIMRFVFRHFIKQESFIADLLSAETQSHDR